MKKLEKKVNSKKWNIEIAYERYNINEVLFKGYIQTDKRKIIECQIEISFKKIIYSWNELNKDSTF